MIVVTAGTGDGGYKSIVAEQRLRCFGFGYHHLMFDLGGLGMGHGVNVKEGDLKPTVNGDSLPPATFKAALTERGMVSYDPVVCWLDGDCLPLKEFLPPGDNWDAAVTLRSPAEVGQSNNPALDYLNSGVVWFRNNEGGQMLVKLWDRASYAMNTDQGALNHVVAPAFGNREWIESLGGIVESPCGAHVLVLDAMEWNCWHLPPKPETRILHFKGGIRSAARNYL